MAVVNYFENNPLFNTGGLPEIGASTFELDASIMEGKDWQQELSPRLKTVKNPINAAYAVKTKNTLTWCWQVRVLTGLQSHKDWKLWIYVFCHS